MHVKVKDIRERTGGRGIKSSVPEATFLSPVQISEDLKTGGGTLFISRSKLMRLLRQEMDFAPSLSDDEILHFFEKRLRSGMSQRNRDDFGGKRRYTVSTEAMQGTTKGWKISSVPKEER